MRAARLTFEQREEILALSRKGTKTADIAYLLGRPLSTVRHIALGKNPTNRMMARDNALRAKGEEMLKLGVTRKVIAAKLGVSNTVLGRVLPPAGDRLRKNTESMHVKLAADLDQRMGAVAQRMGLTKQQFTRLALEEACRAREPAQ